MPLVSPYIRGIRFANVVGGKATNVPKNGADFCAPVVIIEHPVEKRDLSGVITGKKRKLTYPTVQYSPNVDERNDVDND